MTDARPGAPLWNTERRRRRRELLHRVCAVHAFEPAGIEEFGIEELMDRLGDHRALGGARAIGPDAGGHLLAQTRDSLRLTGVRVPRIEVRIRLCGDVRHDGKVEGKLRRGNETFPTGLAIVRSRTLTRS